MSYIESTMLPIGTLAPSFSLYDVVLGYNRELDTLKGKKGTLIAFICNHCPYVIHILDPFVLIAKSFQEEEIGVICISSNDVVKYPDDDPTLMKLLALERGFTFPYLYDETQRVARDYDAACTPDFYLFDENMHLYYRGRLDSSRPKNETPVTGEDLINAAKSMLSQKPPLEIQYPSGGCNIKWKE